MATLPLLQQPLDDAVAAVLLVPGAGSRIAEEGAAEEVIEFLGEVDGRLRHGYSSLEELPGPQDDEVPL